MGPRRVLPPAPQPHSPSGPSLAQLGAGSALLPPLACWASRRAQAPLATTHCYAPRALSRQRRYRLPRAARAPSGHTEGLEEAVSAGGRPARGISEIGGGLHPPCARAVALARWDPAAGTLGGVVRSLKTRKRLCPRFSLPWFHPTRLDFLWPCLNSLF